MLARVLQGGGSACLTRTFYSNTAVVTALSGNVGAGDTAIPLDSVSGFPGSFPYILSLDYETTSEELVKVTGGAGTVLTVERAFGGTSAQTHAAGAVVKHVYNAVDATDARTHEAATTDVHGITGEFVDTSSPQSLANKTLTEPIINAGDLNAGEISGTWTGDPNFSGNPTFTGAPVFTAGGTFPTTAAFEALATQAAILARVIGDAAARLQVGADGTLGWGDGTNAADAALFRDSAASLQMINRLLISRAATDSDCFAVRVNGDAGSRFLIEADGSLYWGSGAAGQDVKLYRSAANVLQTDDQFRATKTIFNTGLVAASGFSTSDWEGRETCGVTSVTLFINVNTPISAGANSNISDTLMCTLPVGCRPPYSISTGWGNGSVDGEARIGPDGQVILRSMSTGQTLESSTTIRLTATWIQ